MEINQYLTMFIDESKEHLQALNENLLKLEKNPEDLSIVQDIFRSAHTLKGMSATMGFTDLSSLTHEMENVLDRVRNGQLAMSSAIFDLLFKGLDSLENMVQDIIDGGTGQMDVSGTVAELQAAASGEVSPRTSAENRGINAAELALDQYQYSVLQQSLDTGHFVHGITVTLREDCVMKAARAYMVFDALERLGEIAKSSPSVQEIEQEQFDRVFSLYYITKEPGDKIADLIRGISEIERVDLETIDKEALAALVSRQSAAKAASGRDAGSRQPSGAKADASAAGNRQQAALGRTIRVDLDRLDDLMNLFSELLIDRVRLEELAGEIRNAALTETVEHMARVSSDLQNIVLKLRMVPVETVFNRFPRMVRDLAKSMNKKLELVITGADTELDRTVIDEIGDPLVHLLRNSVDHGIESPEDRIKSGKTETGTIHLRAYHSGNHVFIEIEDDGRGIDRGKVLDKALKNGLVSPDKAETLTDEEVYQFLFASGFSTAEQVSDISGRGVGLDVVKNKIESLGGRVHVMSAPGTGTTFSVQLPMTLSIIGAMLIRVGPEKYAVPLSSIVETAILRKANIRNVHGQTMMDFRSGLIPLLDLGEVLECPRGEADAAREECEVVIVHKGDKQVAVTVDELLGQQEIVLKPLGKYLTGLFAISGATILGDGQVALILDTNALIK
jgi:two-component system chemotaxis sensor kinase CheA